jgi:hypothetical protein
MSNNTIDPRLLTRHDVAQDLSIDIEMENEPDVGSQIVVGNDGQQFVASPTFDPHEYNLSSVQSACKYRYPAS